MTTNNSATPSPKQHEPKTKPASQVRYNGEIAARVCARIATTEEAAPGTSGGRCLSGEHTSNDLIVTADGRKIPNPVAVQRAKLQVNYRKWIASKLLPRKYGNNAQLDAAAPPPPRPPADGGSILTKEMLLDLQARRRQAWDDYQEEKKTNPNATWPPRR